MFEEHSSQTSEDHARCETTSSAHASSTPPIPPIIVPIMVSNDGVGDRRRKESLEDCGSTDKGHNSSTTTSTATMSNSNNPPHRVKAVTIVDIANPEEGTNNETDDQPQQPPVASDVSNPPTRNNSNSNKTVYRELIIDLADSVHIPNLLQASTTGLRSTLIPIFGSALGANDGVIGVITAMAGVARMLTGVPTGRLTSQHGFTKVMLVAMIINIIGAVVAAVSWNPAILGMSSFLFGGAIGTFITSRHVMLAGIVDKSKRGRMMSIIGGGERWASVIGPVVGGFVIDYAGPRACALSTIPMSLGCMWCVYASSRVRSQDEKYKSENRRREQQLQESGQEPVNRGVASILRKHGSVLFRYGVYSMNVLQLRACRRLMLPLAAVNAGLRPTLVGLVLSVSFLVDASLFWLGGVIMDRFGRKFAAIPTTVNLGIAFIMLAYADSSFSLFLAAIVFGFADSTGSGMLLTMNADYAPKEVAAEFMGLIRTIQDSGQLIGPLIAGWMSDMFTFRTACIMFGVLGMLNAVWAVALLPNEAASDNEPSDNIGLLEQQSPESMKAIRGAALPQTSTLSTEDARIDIMESIPADAKIPVNHNVTN